MITFNFVNPYLIYTVYVSFSFFSIYTLFKWPHVFKRQEKWFYIVAFTLLRYAQFACCGVPYLEVRGP